MSDTNSNRQIPDDDHNRLSKQLLTTLLEIKLIVNPQNMQALRHLGQLYQYECDDLLKAEQYYIKCLDINPNDDFIHFNLAKLYTKQQQFNKALSSFAKCDHTLAAVNYHHGKYLIAVNDPQNALHHFQTAININPQVANYYLEYGKTAIKLNIGYADSLGARGAFVKALELSKYKEAKIVCEYSLCLHYKHYHQLQSQNKPSYYINLALELNPNNVTYKYLQLKYQQRHFTQYDMSKIFTGKCYIPFRIDATVPLLVFGYIKRHSITYIPNGIIMFIYNFIYGGNHKVKMVTNKIRNLHKQLLSGPRYSGYSLTEYCQQEMISMFFDALCPGKDETKLLFTITKLCEFSTWFCNDDDDDRDFIYYVYSKYFFLILQLICKVTNVYNVLSIINQTDHYINYKIFIVELCVKKPASGLLFDLTNDNHNFWTIYQSLVKQSHDNLPHIMLENISIFGQVVTPYSGRMHRSASQFEHIYCCNASNLKYIRLIFMQSLFDIDDNIDGIKAIETLSNMSSESNSWTCEKVLVWLKCEMKCLNKKDLNHKLKSALDKILFCIWDNIEFIYGTSSDPLSFQFVGRLSRKVTIQSLCSIFNMLKNMDLSLKSSKMDWDTFFDKIYFTSSKRSKPCEILKQYGNEVDVDDKDYQNWMHCIDILLHKY